MMQDTDLDPQKIIDALGPFLDLRIAEEHREGVATNLAILARMAALVRAVPLDERQDPAGLYAA